MPVYRLKNRQPVIGQECFVAPSASVIGTVVLGDHVSIWFGAVLRGDLEKIVVGKNSNIQDLVMIHTSRPIPTIIGEGVTVGHNAVLHSCTLEDNVLIGMGAIVLDGAVIGKNSVVAAGTVVPPGKTFPPDSLIMGSPAKVLRPLRAEEKEAYNNQYKNYLTEKTEYLEGPFNEQ